MAETPRKRGKPFHHDLFSFPCTSTFVELQGKLLRSIQKLLPSPSLNLNVYAVKFTIPRVQSAQIPLEDEEKFQLMLTDAARAHKCQGYNNY
jgi:hypothetical protein